MSHPVYSHAEQEQLRQIENDIAYFQRNIDYHAHFIAKYARAVEDAKKYSNMREYAWWLDKAQNETERQDIWIQRLLEAKKQKEKLEEDKIIEYLSNNAKSARVKK
jgi:hypothetical protein